MKISLVISDVDATLITPAHEITHRTSEAVNKLQELGIGFTVASSRPPRGLYGFAKELNLTEPFAAFNGGVIQRTNGETIASHTLSKEICEASYSVTNTLGIRLWVYCDHDWHVDEITPFVEREQNTIGFEATLENDLRNSFGTAAKLVIVGDPAIVSEAETIILETLGSSVSATRSKPRFLDITDQYAHKGSVVTQLADVLNIPVSEIAVIGDGLNDVLMFERAGFSIAMGQSDDEVRSAADVVTGSNTDEGFADAIEYFIIGK